MFSKLFSKVHKFAAKLVLLHYGLLIAVRDIDGAIVPDISDEGDGDDSSKDANVEVIGIVIFQP